MFCRFFPLGGGWPSSPEIGSRELVYERKCIHTYGFEFCAATCDSQIRGVEYNCSPLAENICVNINVKFVPSVCNSLQENENWLLSSSSNSEYILLVYDSAEENL